MGSDFMTNHVVLKLSIMEKEVLWSLSGKQRGNVNYIDTDVAQGDY
jgi:hypothetical protein